MKITVISDTHGRHKELDLPFGDILICCGDFSHSPQSVFAFVKWFGEQKFQYKILIAGNHDTYVETVGYSEMFSYCQSHNVIYLQDTETIINGKKFYGTPWTPSFNNWSFMKDDDILNRYWDNIPDDVEILITHGPAFGIADGVEEVKEGKINVGSKSLLKKIETLKTLNLEYHLFGHIHECYGYCNVENYTAINASLLTSKTSNTLNVPISFEI